ncbi:MAG: NAD(P)-dependent oxidoreductase [Candidatus Blackburnbacteria bacterium]|nr:NAD(P)-dependent oxidoreductase [Candidatus Blackburnbacteria bacterium]
MTTPSFAVLGASGLVLSRFLELYPKTVVSAPDISELDITDQDAILHWTKKLPQTSVVVLGAAYTDVDGAEKEKEDKSGVVYKVNVLGPQNVSLACKQHGLFLIHISTDFVFSGTQDYKGPYREDQEPVLDEENLGWYGQTKFMGEQEVQGSGAIAAILRISYPFRSNYELKIDFARNILFLYDQGKLYPMFSDQYLTPTFVDEAVGVIKKIGEQKLQGVFHCASSNITTPYDFATLLLRRARGATNIVKRSSVLDFRKQFPERSLRPQYGGLDSRKTSEELGIHFMRWEESVDELVKQMATSEGPVGAS